MQECEMTWPADQVERFGQVYKSDVQEVFLLSAVDQSSGV